MKTVLHQDDVSTVVSLQDGNLVTGTVQDCTPIVERTQALHREGFHGSADFKHAASLPVVLVESYCNERGITMDEFMRGKEHIRYLLNDPSLSYFRIWPGRV